MDKDKTVELTVVVVRGVPTILGVDEELGLKFYIDSIETDEGTRRTRPGVCGEEEEAAEEYTVCVH